MNRFISRSLSALSACLCLAFTIGGCVGSASDSDDTSASSNSTTSSEPANTNSAGSSAIVTAPGSSSPGSPPTQPNELTFTVKTNVYGASVAVQDAETGEEVFREIMPTGETSMPVKVPANKTYDITLSLAGLTTFAGKEEPRQNAELEMKFTSSQLDDIRVAATCLLSIPGGGFGSGFLLGDRQTLATAAHCVACENVEELKIVFHPTDPKEKTIQGAKLIYFDAKQDVALLHLAEPVEETRPYFWRSRDSAEEDKIEIVGNPGRGGEPDPMYSRSATVKGVRPDEYFIDIELKPGYSGGPHALADSMDSVGITSFKIAASAKYEEIGLSYAKSVDIAADAYEHWQSLDSGEQERKLARERDRYERRYGYFMVNQANRALLIDSVVYARSCIEVVEDYIRRQHAEVRKLGANPSVAVYNKTLTLFHREYLKTHGPEFAKKVRERLSPKLMMEHYYGDVYERALQSENVPDNLKNDLRQAHEHYSSLREAAETVVDPKGSRRGGKTLEEFLDWTIDEVTDLFHYYDSIESVVEGHLD